MAKDHLTGKFAVILHADIVGSTKMVQQDEQLAHARIQATFREFSKTIKDYTGRVLESRGDALLAEFERPSDAVTAALSFQFSHAEYLASIDDDLRPELRIGIAMGEVVVADDTVTGAGVVMAQRVEQLAESGGLCITVAVRESLSGRLSVEIENLGLHELKGFDEPVGVYQVRRSDGSVIPSPEQRSPLNQFRASWLKVGELAVVVILILAGVYAWSIEKDSLDETVSIDRMTFPLPDKPSIAVLPLSNMSDDVSQEYFADGMTEDLITDLSKIPDIFVIARTTTFSYKGQQIKVNQVAEELGVRYVLEGSVRRAGEQVRINAQLIDATTGGHVWAERYDGKLTDIFGLQDQVVAQIVKALASNLIAAGTAVAKKPQTSTPAAYDVLLQGRQLMHMGEPQDYAKAITYFEKAVELDPGYSRAYAYLAEVYWQIHDNGWEPKVGMLYQALGLARRYLALALAEPTAEAYGISAKMKVVLGDKKESLAEVNRALSLAPNDSSILATRAWILMVSGRAEEAETDARRALRIDPAVRWNTEILATALFHQQRYEEAVVYFERSIDMNPDIEFQWRDLAMTYAYLGRFEEAKAAIAKFNAISGRTLTLQGFESYATDQYDYNRDYLAQMLEGLRLAGVPPGVIEQRGEVSYRDLVTKSAGTFSVEGAIKIDASEAQALHNRGVVFIDVRGKSFNFGHIPGAIHLKFIGQLTRESLAAVTEPDDEVVFYCGGPDCQLSANASAKALTWGYTRVFYFAGGYPEWKQAKYPIEAPQ